MPSGCAHHYELDIIIGHGFVFLYFFIYFFYVFLSHKSTHTKPNRHFGKVYKAKEKKTGEIVAAKILPWNDDDEANSKLKEEISFMKECDTPSIVQFKASYLKENDLWVFLFHFERSHIIFLFFLILYRFFFVFFF